MVVSPCSKEREKDGATCSKERQRHAASDSSREEAIKRSSNQLIKVRRDQGILGKTYVARARGCAGDRQGKRRRVL
jgi:hypothetical protein